MRSVCQLKVTLTETQPPVWRRIEIYADVTLETLHFVIQAAMGWENGHFYSFTCGDQFFPSDEPAAREGFDLGSLLTAPGMRLTYDYGAQGSWRHIIALEEMSVSDGPLYPRCTDGAGLCPDEDVLGPAEFTQNADVRFNADRVNEEFANWRAEDLDDDDFDEALTYDANVTPSSAVWLDTDESLRLAAIEEYHVEHEPHLPPDSLTVHAILHDGIETQLAAKGVSQLTHALDRLKAAGVGRHESIHILAGLSKAPMMRPIESDTV